MSSTTTETPNDLYLHGSNNICRNCGEHVSKHESKYTKSSPFGKAYVCPPEAER